MALVDYSSDSSSDEPLPLPPLPRSEPRPSDSLSDEPAPPRPPRSESRPSDPSDPSPDQPPRPEPRPAKRLKSGAGAGPKPPPLPRAFHDLYASTVRLSNVDDPALHHGRRRKTPHVAGNWPSHVYVEWYPTEDEDRQLTGLVAAAQRQRVRGGGDRDGPGPRLHSFLASDTGSPLPLHVSLSRPIVLTTGNKDAFLERAARAVRTSGVRPFAVRPASVAWHHSPDSNRTFLILRVVSATSAMEGTGMDQDKDGSGGGSGSGSGSSTNPELSRLLARLNSAARHFAQPELYALSSAPSSSSSGRVDAQAFHVSIGWILGGGGDDEDPPAGGDRSGTSHPQVEDVLDSDEFRPMKKWAISVDAVKVKIGNVVTSIPLGRDAHSEDALLFGAE